MKNKYIKNQQQQSTATEYNRYPNHYMLTSCLLESIWSPGKNQKILVFGCSTGEEHFCLVKKYFYQSNHLIDAVDISEQAIESAKKKINIQGLTIFSPKTFPHLKNTVLFLLIPYYAHIHHKILTI